MSAPANVAPAHLYFESRYRKLARGLPQTIFYCPTCKGHRRRRRTCTRCEGRGKLTRDSVQELIGRKVLPAFRAREGKFHGAGREDIDVLMLGQGRPFVYEVIAPKRFDVDMELLRAEIHQDFGERIQVDPLVAVDKGRVAFWKEAKFAKVYRARVALAEPVPPERAEGLAGRTVEITQRTPMRVAHRRADLERTREVTILACRLLEPQVLEIEVRCSHGTYVKEWVSGEEGRTSPALPDVLGVACRCEVLDVLDVLTAAPQPVE